MSCFMHVMPQSELQGAERVAVGCAGSLHAVSLSFGSGRSCDLLLQAVGAAVHAAVCYAAINAQSHVVPLCCMACCCRASS